MKLLTLSRKYNTFIQYKNYSYWTKKHYDRYAKAFISFVGNKDIRKVSLTLILKYRASLTGIKENTIFQYMLMVRRLLDFARENGIKVVSPRLVPLPKYRNASWSPANADILLQLLKVNDAKNKLLSLRNELILRFLFATGMRVSELCDMTISQISLTKKEARIVTKKSKIERLVLWDDLTNEILSAYIDKRLMIARSEYLFVSTAGKRLTTRTIQRIMKNLCLKAKIKERFVPHSWRHNFLTEGAEKNIHMSVLQKFAGHTNLLSTQPYIHAHEPILRQEYDRVYENRIPDPRVDRTVDKSLARAQK